MATHRAGVRVIGSLLTAALLCAAPATVSAQFVLRAFTIDGGGGQSAGGTFALHGTIGQPDAGVLSGSTFVLAGGFWFGGTVSAVGVEEAGDVAPESLGTFRLLPPRPNPVATSTIVAFDLPAPDAVRATIYDVGGRLVRVLVDERLPAGRHARTWDRRDRSGRVVSSGMYFLRVDAGEQRAHRKIVVMAR
ncbi:MAG: T9SS type A sorting domain-containing protein [bacterium]